MARRCFLLIELPPTLVDGYILRKEAADVCTTTRVDLPEDVPSVPDVLSIVEGYLSRSSLRVSAQWINDRDWAASGTGLTGLLLHGNSPHDLELALRIIADDGTLPPEWGNVFIIKRGFVSEAFLSPQSSDGVQAQLDLVGISA